MSKQNKKNNSAASDNAVVITANPADFRHGTLGRRDRLVEAVKPITDVWYPRFFKAAKRSSDAIVRAWLDYDRIYFHNPECPNGVIFRDAAIMMILNTVHTVAYDKKSGIRETAREVLGLIRDRVRRQTTCWWSRRSFNYETATLGLAKEIDTLNLEYPEVK